MKYFKQVLISVLILEIINLLLGIVKYGNDAFLPYTAFNEPPLYYDIDSLYGVTRLKNTKQIISYPWGGVLTKTNSLGFVDDEFDTNGILVTGNSFVEGYGINKNARFTEILEHDIKGEGSINNAGSSGAWSPIQSLMVLRDLLKNKKMDFKKSFLILTPGEVINLDKRSPNNDPQRNYPYRDGDSIVFHKAEHSNFTNRISIKNKIKRFTKSLLISKIYFTFKYYGSPKVKQKILNYDKAKLDWFIKKIEEENFDKKINIIVINNLARTKIKNIENYKNKSKKVDFFVINFPNELDNYFISNRHLNKKGNKVLAKLLKPIMEKK
ncbi:hypothetical protein BWZ22_14780 [Seonamhaeicola sp. S2-3]|uniref:hypothetical protein n=1 Tax=Seonamhaeicola sp. S2-3 TaxID=1936081 RepID=UPI0009727891|nr:hypothetical protein [Seonamhaeicola sp. S2-3]APY12410.1 hypothetical protein BWZ22_14780 [Seonamhaeicola sp. S2-3]